MKFISEYMHIENRISLPVFKKIVGKIRGTDAYIEKRKDLKITCPILKKIINVERIKCTNNKMLNYKDIYET